MENRLLLADQATNATILGFFVALRSQGPSQCRDPTQLEPYRWFVKTVSVTSDLIQLLCLTKSFRQSLFTYSLLEQHATHKHA